MKEDPLHLQILAWEVYLVTVPMPNYAYPILSPYMTLIFSRITLIPLEQKVSTNLLLINPMPRQMSVSLNLSFSLCLSISLCLCLSAFLSDRFNVKI